MLPALKPSQTNGHIIPKEMKNIVDIFKIFLFVTCNDCSFHNIRKHKNKFIFTNIPLYSQKVFDTTFRIKFTRIFYVFVSF